MLTLVLKLKLKLGCVARPRQEMQQSIWLQITPHGHVVMCQPSY